MYCIWAILNESSLSFLPATCFLLFAIIFIPCSVTSVQVASPTWGPGRQAAVRNMVALDSITHAFINSRTTNDTRQTTL
jgi:hypothetical protein